MAIFNLNKVLNAYQFSYNYKGHRIFFKLICKSGLELSVQASHNHYCRPWQTVSAECYECFEIGFPSKPVELLKEYAEQRGQWCNTVYGWVPRSTIKKVIRQNGGIVAVYDQENNKTVKL